MPQAPPERDDNPGPRPTRRALIRRVGATAAVAWAAPEILATQRAHAMTGSTCPTIYDFETDLQGWTAASSGPAGWRRSTAAAFTGTTSVWFGRPGSADSLHPVVGADSYSGGVSRGTFTSPATVVAATDVASFWVRLAIENGNKTDSFELLIVQGSKRKRIWDKRSGGFAVIDHPEQPKGKPDLYTTNGGFVQVVVAVGNPGGIDLTQPVHFEFDFQTVDAGFNRTEGIYLDQISIPCVIAPEALPVLQGRGGTRTTESGGLLPGYQPPAPKPVVPRDADPGAGDPSASSSTGAQP